MKRKSSTLTKAITFIFAFFLIIAGCEREEFEAPLMLEIHFNAQQNNPTKQSGNQKSAQIVSTNKQLLSLKSVNDAKSAIENGASYTIYGTGVTGLWWTDPATAISWQITNSAISLDSTITSEELISFTFQELGVYTIRAFNPPPYGFEWFMTVSVVSSLDEALIVNPTFIRSEYIGATNMFRYIWRVPKPIVLDGSETLFRVFGFSGQTYNPFPVFFDQTIFFGNDSIEWYYDLPPNGLTPVTIKTNVGFVNSLLDEIWLTVDTTSEYSCDDLVDNNVIEVINNNGQIWPVGTDLSVPTDVQTGAGDHGQEIPVVLMGTPVAGTVPIYALSSPQTNMWRHRLISEADWTEVSVTQASGRINLVLPAHATYNQRVVQYGYMDSGSFVPDPYMELSTLYNSTVQGFSFAY